MDVDMSADLVELAERVFTALDNVSSKKEELREQIVLILLADAGKCQAGGDPAGCPV